MLPVKNVLSKSQNQEHFHENTIIYIRCIHENCSSSVCFLSRKIRPSKLTLEKFDRRFIPKRFDNIPCVSQEPWNNITHIQYDYSKIILPYKLCITYAMSSKYIFFVLVWQHNHQLNRIHILLYIAYTANTTLRRSWTSYKIEWAFYNSTRMWATTISHCLVILNSNSKFTFF